MSDMRALDQVRGGLFSIINSMFYPLSMLSVFIKDGKQKVAIRVMLIVVLLIDVLFLGTRNAPFFILLYLLVFNKSLIEFRFKTIWYLFLVVLVMTLLFFYTTTARSGVVDNLADYWFWKSTESAIFESGKVNFAFYEWINENIPFILPFLYMISYISHSIPNFHLFIISDFNWFNPTFAHFLDQIALYTFGDREVYQNLIAESRVRYGYYQTLYTSLIIDFGILSIFGALILFIFLRCPQQFMALKILMIMFFMLSSIENYFYQGLKPLHYFYFVTFYYIFVTRRSFKSFQ
jgi:hypothetical protein